MALSSSNLLAGSGTSGNPTQSALTTSMQPGFSAAQLANLASKGVNNSTISLTPPKTGASAAITTPPASTYTAPTSTTTSTTSPASTAYTYTPPASTTVAPTVPATQYSDNGKSVGTQLPGMAGFNPQTPVTPPSGGYTSYTPAGVAITTGNGGSSTTGTPTYGGLVGSLANVAQNGSPAVQSANNALTNFRASEANTLSGINSQPTSARVMQGRDAQVQLANAQKENALSTGVTNALTGQGQQISGLNEAASLAAPSLGSYGSTYYNPLTGQTVPNSQGLNPQTDATNYAQQVMSGKMTYDQALSALGYAGTAGSEFLNNAITSAGGNPLQLQASGAGAQSGISTVAANTGAITAGQQTQIANYTSAAQQGQALASQASDLITQFGLNPSELNAANGAIQKIAENTSNPQYQILSNYLNDIAARYSQVLTPPGGAATDTTRAIAAGMLNATASGTSLQAVLAALDQQAQAVIANVSTTGGATTGTTGGSSAGFGWDGN